MPKRAKIFNNGGSQAIRLPMEYRFKGAEVQIRRVGNALLVEAYEPGSWPDKFWDHMPTIDEEDWSRPEDSVPSSIETEVDIS